MNLVQWRFAMDQTTCPGHSAVLDRDDAQFADERRRYIRHCTEGGATAASLKIKRNEHLWIAARLGPNASEGIDIEALQRIATERQQLQAAIPPKIMLRSEPGKPAVSPACAT